MIYVGSESNGEADFVGVILSCSGESMPTSCSEFNPLQRETTTRFMDPQLLKVLHDAELSRRIPDEEAEALESAPRPELELSPPRSSRLKRWDHYDTAHRKVSVASMLNPNFDLILRRPIDRRISHHDCKDVQL